MIDCNEARLLLDAYFDSELELASTAKMNEHLAGCAGCKLALDRLQALRNRLTPAVFQLATPAEIRRLRLGALRRRWWKAGALTLTAIAAGVLAAIWLPWASSQPDVRELVDAHVRSLSGNHLIDVASTDQHAVKPWFQGKVNFAPDVVDLSAKGFELVGGRLDVLKGKPAAAIVYKRRSHYLNVWVARGARAEAQAGPSYRVLDGFRIAHWTASGLDHWVVSDMASEEFELFCGYLREH